MAVQTNVVFPGPEAPSTINLTCCMVCQGHCVVVILLALALLRTATEVCRSPVSMRG